MCNTTVISILEPRYSLENDPNCGLTTGGREECWWSCGIQRVEDSFTPGLFIPFIPDPSCLSDCYPADHCLSALLEDYKAAGGICRGSFLDVLAPGLFPVSSQSCELYNPEEECDCTLNDFYNNVCTFEQTIAADCYWLRESDVKRGLCSERTKQLLTTDQQNCILQVDDG